MAVAESYLVKKKHQISTVVNQKITQKFIEKVPMTAIAESLSVSTSTVIRKLKEFKFMTDLSFLPTHMSWDEYSFKKGLMNFIAQNFDSRKIVAILDGRTQVTIRNHFLRYSRLVRNRVKVITMDMFSPYYDIARKLRFRISRLRLKQSPRLFHSLILKSFWIVFTLSNISVEIWTVFASKSWISLIRNRTNIRYWNVAGNSAINVFIAQLFDHTWLIKRFSKNSLYTLKNLESTMKSINSYSSISKRNKQSIFWTDWRYYFLCKYYFSNCF